MNDFTSTPAFMLLIAPSAVSDSPAPSFIATRDQMLRMLYGMASSEHACVQVYEWREGGYRLAHCVTSETEAAFLVRSGGIDPAKLLTRAA